MTKELGLDSQQRQEIFTLLHSIQTNSLAQPASYTIVTRGISLGVKWQKREADHSPQSNAKVMNVQDIPPFPIHFDCCGA
jgi:hypothetical protein